MESQREGSYEYKTMLQPIKISGLITTIKVKVNVSTQLFNDE